MLAKYSLWKKSDFDLFPVDRRKCQVQWNTKNELEPENETKENINFYTIKAVKDTRPWSAFALP